MAHPFASEPRTPLVPLSLLRAPVGQLSADGQLRELMQERRSHGPQSGRDQELWYLTPELCDQSFGRDDLEAIVSAGDATAVWLQLRFGGELLASDLPIDWLRLHARLLPPAAAPAPVGVDSDG